MGGSEETKRITLTHGGTARQFLPNLWPSATALKPNARRQPLPDVSSAASLPTLLKITSNDSGKVSSGAKRRI
jgi:hypothetical protein